jgi:hypothetical protein
MGDVEHPQGDIVDFIKFDSLKSFLTLKKKL